MAKGGRSSFKGKGVGKRRFQGPRKGGSSRTQPGRERPLPKGPSGWQKTALEKTEAKLKKLLAPPPPPSPEELKARLDPFHLDGWQKEAVDELEAGHHVVVDAPTTAGKTRVIESFFHRHLQDPTFRAVYTTPVKSLSNDKLREFRVLFGREYVGISTGDIKENLQAPIVVATLESYRNSLLGVEPDLGRTIVVFDEYHYIQDISRGSAWEEAIILSPPTCQVLLLSASVANADEFAAWISTIHSRRDSRLITVQERPVPLEDMVYDGDHWYLAEFVPDALLKARYFKDQAKLDLEEIGLRLSKLPPGLSPTIVYAGKRMSCEELGRQIARFQPPITREELEPILETLQEAEGEVSSGKFIPHNLLHMIKSKGVAYHHSGLPAPARIAIESLIKKGQLRFCSATMGLSLGINFAVRSALISDLVRPGEGGLTGYDTSEVLQMLGRAGRRGRDLVGFSLWSSFAQKKLLDKKVRGPCQSNLRHDPVTFLGLVSRGYSLSGIENFYRKSFRRYKKKDQNTFLVTPKRLKQVLGTGSVPCVSAAHAFIAAMQKKTSPCDNCKVVHPCHRYIKQRADGDLASMHLHLHRVGALDDKEKLTPFGEIARYLPQGGGLLIAKAIHDGDLNGDNLGQYAELLAALSLARHKEPSRKGSYKFPFSLTPLEARLEKLYPLRLFPELYDLKPRRYNEPVIREFNPEAGYIINLWIRGIDYTELVKECSGDFFSSGDIMNLIYRVATYLQSISQAKVGDLSRLAAELRRHILRHPLEIAMNIG